MLVLSALAPSLLRSPHVDSAVDVEECGLWNACLRARARVQTLMDPQPRAGASLAQQAPSRRPAHQLCETRERARPGLSHECGVGAWFVISRAKGLLEMSNLRASISNSPAMFARAVSRVSSLSLLRTAHLSLLGLPPAHRACLYHMSAVPAPLPENSIKELVGDASTTESLLACKIGGCCGKDTPLLSLPALHDRLKAIPHWTLSEDQTVISRALVAKNWAAAMGFFNAVGAIAEEEGHHPDLHLTGWRNVRVDLSTHAIGGCFGMFRARRPNSGRACHLRLEAPSRLRTAAL